MASTHEQKKPNLQFTGDTVPNLVDKRARLTPDAIYAEYPVSALTYDEGYRTITYRDFANAVNGAAGWLQSTLGPGQGFETLAYMGPNDLRYPALILGAVKAGYKLFLTSPRNSVAAQFNLFQRLKCKILLSSAPRPPAVNAISDSQDFRVVEVPSVEYLLNTHHPHVPFTKTFEEALLDPLFVVHTSGSTGIPKPLIYTHATAATNTKMMSLDPPDGYESQDRMYQGKRVFITFPPFHGAYLVTHLFNAVSFGTVMIAPVSGALPSGEGLIEGLKKTPAEIAFTVPSIVQDLAQNPILLEYCAKNLDLILYCGGDLPQAIGDVVAPKIKLVNQFGASELGLTPNLLSKTDRSLEDWKYVQFHPKLGLELRHSTEGMHELHAVRDPKLKALQPTFTIFPDAQEYASRDLFVRHPSKGRQELWRWQARADDIIVFLNGEKTNPNSLEQHIVARNQDISAALVVGAQRFQAALIVEPATNDKELTLAERAAFIERIWPTIEEANEDAPSHARIMKSHIMFTNPKKPMLRAGKGTVQRSGTLRSYTAEIDTLYRDADTMSANVDPAEAGTAGDFDKNILSKKIQHSILEIANWKSLNDSDNLFTLGMDSLQALVLVRKLKQSLAMPNIALSTIYTNPSVNNLTDAVMQLADQTKASKTSSEQKRIHRRIALLDEYRKKIDRIKPQPGKRVEYDQEVVVLTGSTGALGSYFLDNLLRNPAVARVICLNRAQDSLSLQLKRNETRGLPDPRTLGKETSFFTADLTQERLGLSTQVFDTLLADTTLVIHNAWPVNFNLPLPSFRPQLDGLIGLLDMITQSQRSPQLFFISSISSVMSYRSSSSIISENLITADTAPGPNGYAESKNVAEHLVGYASQKFGFLCSIARVGQIAGAVEHTGIWSPDEWFPSLIITSAHLSAIPDSLGSAFSTIDWIPIDLLPGVLFELAHGQQGSMHQTGLARVFHPLNPEVVSWEALRDTVANELHSQTGKSMEIVSLRTWISRVRKEIESGTGIYASDDSLETILRAVPAAKLLDFYEALLTSEDGPPSRLDATETIKSSEKLREIEGIKGERMRKWIREWMAWRK